MKRVIIYARVSTKEQNVNMQLSNLLAYTKARKLNVVKKYIEYASGVRSNRLKNNKIFERATGLEPATSSLGS